MATENVVPTNTVTQTDEEGSDFEDASETLPITFLIKFIKEFDGNREHLSSYLADCNRAFELAKGKQQSVLLDYTLTRITGKAKSACVNRTFESWNELKQYLKTMYQDTKHKAQLLCELTTLKQKPDENLSTFTTRMETCLKRTINAITQGHDKGTEPSEIDTQALVLKGKLEMLQEIALNRYTYFTIPEISNALRIRDIKTLNEAIAIAKAELQIQQMISGPSTSKDKLKPNGNSKGFKSNSNSQADKSKIHCKYCKKPGHSIEECRKRAYNNSKNVNVVNTGKSPNQPSKDSRTCNYCKKTGHIIKDCYKKKYNDKKSKEHSSDNDPKNLHAPSADAEDHWNA